MFIFGAGFTKSVFPHSPLNSELISALMKKFSAKEIENLQQYYSTNDIEIALSKLDIEISIQNISELQKHDDLFQLRKNIENYLALFFGEYNASEDLLEKHIWLNQFINEMFSVDDVVVSLNYDCLLEGLLDCAGK